MCCDEIEEAGFVLGLAKAAQVPDAGFRHVHASQTQDGGHNFAVIANAPEAGCAFRDGASQNPAREVPSFHQLEFLDSPAPICLGHINIGI